MRASEFRKQHIRFGKMPRDELSRTVLPTRTSGESALMHDEQHRVAPRGLVRQRGGYGCPEIDQG